MADAEQLIQRVSTEGTLLRGLVLLHTRFGTPTRVIDLAVVAMIVVIVASGGRVPWVARAYGCAIALIVVLTVAALVRIRRTNRGPTPFRTPANVWLGGHELPLGLLLPGVVVGVQPRHQLGVG